MSENTMNPSESGSSKEERMSDNTMNTDGNDVPQEERVPDDTANLAGSDTPRRHKSGDRRPKDIYAMSEKDKKRLKKRGKDLKRLKEIERVIKPLVAIKATQGSLRGTGQRNEAARTLGVSVWRIDAWVNAYLDDPRIESLVDKRPGRSKGRVLSEEQQDIACFFFINPTSKIVYPDGSSDEIPATFDIDYIYSVIQKICPEPKWSIHTLRRYLQDLKAENPLVVIRAQKGENYMINNKFTSMKNDVEGPNQRWQIDARSLPIYVDYNGVVCTVTFLQILDDYSWYPVRHRIIPKRVINEEGVPKRADFTSGDVGILLASAMHYEGVRPESLYTDNGSQIIAIDDFLEDLTDENETLVKMTNSIPGRPRGRGKIEKFLGLLDEILKRLPANFVGKEEDFMAISDARRAKNMLKFEKFCDIMDEYIDELRKRPRNKREKTSRDIIWRSKPALPAPPIRKLKVLTPERVEKHVAVSNWKITFDKLEYEPFVQNADDMYRWLIASARSEFVPLQGAKLDAGWALEVSFDGEHWNECFLKSARKMGKDQYNEILQAVLERIRQDHADIFDRVKDIVKQLGVDELQKDVITNQPLIVNESLKSVPPPSIQEAKVSSTPRPSHGRAPSLKPKNPSKPKNTDTRDANLEWDEMPDVSDIMRQIDKSLEEDGVSNGSD